MKPETPERFLSRDHLVPLSKKVLQLYEGPRDPHAIMAFLKQNIPSTAEVAQTSKPF